ncbi:MAG: hypothetical protein Q8Q94_02110 [bacterium]|nr:hypothetical protein [bacterium]MDZ4299419.1 hypothetical protein [Candidatus Sungbacteria bacterium]
MSEDLQYDRQREVLLFSVRLSQRYHIRRQMFFDLVDRTFLGMIIFAALSVMATVWLCYPCAVVGGIALLCFVFAYILYDSSEKVGTHYLLACHYHKFERAMIAEDRKKCDLEKLRDHITALYQEEPPRRTLIHALAYNDMACGCTEGIPVLEYRLTVFQRLFAHILDGTPALIP